MNTPVEKRTSRVGGFLLGVGLGCLLLLVPRPAWMPIPALPTEGMTPDLVAGGLCLLIGALCLLLPRRSRPSTRLARSPEQAQEDEERTPASAEHSPFPEPGSDDAEGPIPPWLLDMVLAHRSAGREEMASAIFSEWEMCVSSSAHLANSGDLRLLPCQVCGLPDLAALLYLCVRCRGLAHEQCSTFVRRAQEEGTTLSCNPRAHPLCHTCLEELQRRGFRLLSDQSGLLLLQPDDGSDDL